MKYVVKLDPNFTDEHNQSMRYFLDTCTCIKVLSRDVDGMNFEVEAQSVNAAALLNAMCNCDMFFVDKL